MIVRKRPIAKKELNNGEIDCVSTINPKIFVHECKIKVDGITKYIDDHEFVFDNTFSEKETTEDVYRYTIHPTINMILNRGILTCFAYGQTGSGKTFTMVTNESNFRKVFKTCQSNLYLKHLQEFLIRNSNFMLASSKFTEVVYTTY